MKCEYCNLDHPKDTLCPVWNQRDKIYACSGHEVVASWREPPYGSKLEDGFNDLYSDENIIIDKFGVPHNSGG